MPSGLAMMKPTPVVTTTKRLRRIFDNSAYKCFRLGLVCVVAVSSIDVVVIFIEAR
jgi:hypothetical protein